MDKEEKKYSESERGRLIEEVGAMSYKAVAMAKSMVKPGARLLDVANAVEKFVRDNGFGLAFPVNLSVNSEAAHYTPSVDDERVFSGTDLVKVDFGAEKDGFLGDCAASVDLSGSNAGLVEGVEDALSAAISSIRDGVTSGRIGSEIAKAIESKGGRPIRNLGGHGVERHDLHSGFFIPNWDDGSKDVLKEGTVVAIEPFATSIGAEGMVTEGDTCEIFSYVEDASVRSPVARQLLSQIRESHQHDPFAARWLSTPGVSRFSLYAGMQELLRSGALEPHPTLIEVRKGLVAQAEAEVLVEKDGCKVLTK